MDTKQKRGRKKVPKELAKSRETAKFIREKAAKPKRFYQDVGLVDDPNKVIGVKKVKKQTKQKPKDSSDFVKELEAKANKPQKKNFKFGQEMCRELEYYIEKYGDDYQAMSRDKKNIYQDSPGQLKYKILKYIKIHKAGSKFTSICKLFTTLSERRVVSKPELTSRLRYVDIIKRCDETDAERAYRIQYEELQSWNNRYWAKNNEMFQREKDEYIEKNFGQELSKEEALSHDQLSTFYRDFLEKNREKHVNYNKVWYKNHLALLASSIEAKLSRLKVNVWGDHDLKEHH